MADANEAVTIDYARRHLRLGWWSLFTFTALGLVLELFHGFKVRAYLDVANETRRLMWTLAHAHGTILSILNLVFALIVRGAPEYIAARERIVSRTLAAATVLVPAAFLLGGVGFFSGDPGLGVLLLPVGAFLLLTALYFAGRAADTSRITGPPAQTRKERRSTQSGSSAQGRAS